MAEPRFTMVVLLVDDLARSIGFYRRLGVVFPEVPRGGPTSRSRSARRISS